MELYSGNEMLTAVYAYCKYKLKRANSLGVLSTRSKRIRDDLFLIYLKSIEKKKTDFNVNNKTASTLTTSAN